MHLSVVFLLSKRSKRGRLSFAEWLFSPHFCPGPQLSGLQSGLDAFALRVHSFPSSFLSRFCTISFSRLRRIPVTRHLIPRPRWGLLTRHAGEERGRCTTGAETGREEAIGRCDARGRLGEERLAAEAPIGERGNDARRKQSTATASVTAHGLEREMGLEKEGRGAPLRERRRRTRSAGKKGESTERIGW